MKNLEYLMGVLLFQPKPEKILLLGTGGGSLVHFLRFHYPQSNLITVDIDAELVELMHEKMALPGPDQHLTYVFDDAEHYLSNCTEKFDLILIDIFAGILSPDWLLEMHSIHRIYSLLSTQGAVAYNLLIDSDHSFKNFYQNLMQVFNHKSLALPVKGLDNTIAYGIGYDSGENDMTSHIERAAFLSELHDINYMEVLSAIYDTNPSESGLI